MCRIIDVLLIAYKSVEIGVFKLLSKSICQAKLKCLQTDNLHANRLCLLCILALTYVIKNRSKFVTTISHVKIIQLDNETIKKLRLVVKT